MSLEAKNIVSGYEKTKILHDVSITAKKSQTVALVGPNGSGKSTLLKSIFGLLKIDQGSILFNGENITGLKLEKVAKKGISFLHQNRSAFPQLTVRENLEMGAYIIKDHKQINKQIDEVYDLFPFLKKKENTKAINLSGGQLRMLEIATVMVASPKIILMDEPSAGLAPKLVKKTYDKINEIRKSGITLVIVEQNVRQILSIANYGYVLNMGRIALEGTPQNLLSCNTELRKLYLV
jgi:branched-chain amino acid transport system ATP-binding protein